MFDITILSSPFTTAAADYYYDNKGIPRFDFLRDVSMGATLRALLINRFKADSKLSYHNTADLTVFSEKVELNSDEKSLNLNTVIIPRGYKEFVDLELFAKQKKFVLRFLINEKEKKTIIIGKKNMKCWHFIQSLIPRILPWYFYDAPITPEEKGLLESLLLDNPLKYSVCLSNIASGIDFYSQFLKDKLTNFDAIYEERELKTINDRITRVNNEISRLENELARSFYDKRELEIRKTGLITGGFKGSGTLEFLMENHDVVELKCVRDDRIDFLVKTHLITYDQDYFESSIDNHESVFYKSYGVPHKGFTQDELELLFKAIFLEQVLKVRVCGSFSIDSGGRDTEFAISHEQYPPNYDTYLPNQHLDVYGCLGTYRTIIASAVFKFEFPEAIQACIAATTCVNMSESSTVLKFVEKILQENMRFIELPDGSVATAKEAVDFLKKERGLNDC